MSTTVVLTVFVGVLAALSALSQHVQLARFGPSGVSAATWCGIAVVNTGWAVHLAERGLTLMASVSVALAVLTMTVALAAKPSGRLVATAAIVAALMAATQFVPFGVGGAVLVVATVGMFVPQAVKSGVAAVSGKGAAGVAVSTWVLNSAIAGLWLVWGVAASSPWTVAANVPTLMLATAVMLLTMWSHRSGADGRKVHAASVRR